MRGVIKLAVALGIFLLVVGLGVTGINADASVRPLAASMSPEVFEAMATIAGR